MRRRDRYTHAVWLAKFEDQAGDGRTALPAAHLLKGTTDLLHQLGRMGYMIEMQLDHEHYSVRCWAMQGRMPIGLPPMCLSYSGTFLPRILASALTEASRLARLEHRYVASTKEVVRWVS